MQVQPYLFFDGRAEEAAEFYRRALGAEVTMLMRFKESPDPAGCPAGSEEKVMHMSLQIGKTQVLASDGRCTGKPNFQGFGLTITVASEAEADRVFAALGDGGKVQMPLGQDLLLAALRHGRRPLRCDHGWSSSEGAHA